VPGRHQVHHQRPFDRTRYGVFSQGCLSCLWDMPVAFRPSLGIAVWPEARLLGVVPGAMLSVQVTCLSPLSSIPTRPVFSRKDTASLTHSGPRCGVSERERERPTSSEAHTATASRWCRRRQWTFHQTSLGAPGVSQASGGTLMTIGSGCALWKHGRRRPGTSRGVEIQG
jgi:hypothetical protein